MITWDLGELETSPVRSLADVIAFNGNNSDLEMIKEYGEDYFLAADATNGIGKVEKEAVKNLNRLSKEGFVKLMKEKKLDELVCGGPDGAGVLAIGGFPGISVPAAYDAKGVPLDLVFGGLKGSEPTLIEIAYGFEQATNIRKPPKLYKKTPISKFSTTMCQKLVIKILENCTGSIPLFLSSWSLIMNIVVNTALKRISLSLIFFSTICKLNKTRFIL